MKRVIRTLLAASLAFGIVLFGLAGPQPAQALSGQAAEHVEQLHDLYVNHLDDSDRDDIKAARQALLSDAAPNDSYAPLADFLSLHPDVDFTAGEIAGAVKKLVDALDLEQDVGVIEDNLDDFRLVPGVRDFFAKLLQPAGLGLEGANGLDPADAVAFLEAFRAAVVQNIDFADAIIYLVEFASGGDLTDVKAALKADLQEAFADLLEQEDLLLSQALAAYVDDDASALTEAVADTLLALADKYDPQYKAIRALVKGTVKQNVEFASTVSNQGLRLTPKLTIFGREIPNEVLVWTVESANGPITFDEDLGAFVLGGSAAANTTYTATVAARDFLLEIPFFTGTIQMTYTPSSSTTFPTPTPTPAVLVPPAQEELQQRMEEAERAIEEAAQQLESAPPEQQAEIVKEAVKQAQQALNEASKLTLAVPLAAEDGKASVAMTEAAVRQIVEQIQTIAQQAAQINEALKQVNENAAVVPVLTLDLGQTDAEAVELPLAGEVLAAAAEAGIVINVTINNVAVVFDPAEFEDTATLTIARVDPSAIESGADESSEPVPAPGRIVAPVYEFTFTSGDREVTQFARPVGMQIPVEDTDGVDTDVLALAKILPNGYILQPGRYDPETGAFVSKTSQWSIYTVSENSVEFSDTASVESWAGREIRSIAAGGVVEGRGGGVFDPNANVTRAEFAKMLAIALGISGVDAEETFDDVRETDWFRPYVAVLQKWGITNGRHSPSTFMPNEYITRAEIAAMIARGLQAVDGRQGFAGTDAMLSRFADEASIHATLRAGAAFAVEYGIIQGKPGGVFDPNSFATRAEAAVMIYRLLHLE